MPQRLLVLAAMLAVVLCNPAWAGTRTIETEYTYMMGETDTRAQARRLCFQEAKRQAVEQAGTVVQSSTEVSNLALTHDEISTFASAFVEAELIGEKFFAEGDAFGVRCLVRARVDTDSLSRKLADYSADPARKGRLEALARRVGELEARAGIAPDANAAQAEPRPLPEPEELAREKARLRDEVSRLSRAARQVVEPGMTAAEVVALLGPPRVKKLNDNMTSVYECHNYGTIWVVYKDGLVACTRKRLSWRDNYQSDCHCAGWAGEVNF